MAARRAYAISLFFGFPLGHSSVCQFGSSGPATALSISISAKADRVRSGSPLVIEVKLKNVSGHEIYTVAGPEATSTDIPIALKRFRSRRPSVTLTSSSRVGLSGNC